MNSFSVKNILDLGCGNAKSAGSIGVDICVDTEADVIADINAPYLPFKSETIDEVIMTDSLEHTNDVRATLKEVARLLRQDGSVFIRAPHFSSLHAYSDFTHQHFFSAEGMRMLFQNTPQYGNYTIDKLKISYLKIRMWKIWRWLGVEWFANTFTQVYEKLFAFWFTAMCLEIRLTLTTKSDRN